jgi:hypothetical protein
MRLVVAGNRSLGNANTTEVADNIFGRNRSGGLYKIWSDVSGWMIVAADMINQIVDYAGNVAVSLGLPFSERRRLRTLQGCGMSAATITMNVVGDQQLGQGVSAPVAPFIHAPSLGASPLRR